jgi:uncharacterized caspase-like protein
MKRASLVGIASIAVLVTFLALAASLVAQERGRPSPVTDAHLAKINGLFKASGIKAGLVGRNQLGKVELRGQFQDEEEVDRAFSLAQTIVGVRWVSFFTPQDIEHKRWERGISDLFPRPGQPSPPITPSTKPADDQPPGPVAEKYALVVGVGQFRNQIQPLQYANKDAYDFYVYLVDPAGGNFKRDNVVLLRDGRATRDATLDALKQIRERAQENDLVLLYFSSHGTPPDKFGGVHLVTYDSEVKPRERIWKTSLTEYDLREFIQTVRAKRLIVLMDACYSNGAYGRVAGFLPQGGKSLDGGVDEGFGRSKDHMAKRILGAKDLLVDEPSPPGSMAAGAGSPSGWGKVLVSASDAGERSWESDQLHNSVFTRYFLDGLRSNGGAVSESFDYAKMQVPQQVRREKGPDVTQVPQITASRRGWNMSLAVPEHY